MGFFCCFVSWFAGATYCLCNDGVGDQALQKALDYACGSGADCSAIQQSGDCYNPNTLKDHCSYAVNSYFQNQGQVAGSCDFAGTASVSANPPTSKTPFLLPNCSFFFSQLIVFKNNFFLVFVDIPSTCTYPSRYGY